MAGNVIEGMIKGYEEEKTKCNYSFCGVNKSTVEGYFYLKYYKMYKIALVITFCIKPKLSSPTVSYFSLLEKVQHCSSWNRKCRFNFSFKCPVITINLVLLYVENQFQLLLENKFY